MGRIKLTKEQNQKYLGQAIRYFRLKYEMSLEELDFHADIPHKDISKIELGYRNITIDTLKKICDGLQVDEADIYNYAKKLASEDSDR